MYNNGGIQDQRQKILGIMKRPILKLEKERIDIILQSSAFLMLGLTWLMVIIQYKELPEVIPVHYNAAGEADSWGNKGFIFVLPVVALVLSILMNKIADLPHLHNYSEKINEENAKEKYKNSARFLRTTILWMNVIFFFLMILILRSIGSGRAMIGSWVLPFIFISLALLVGIGFYYINRKSTN